MTAPDLPDVAHLGSEELLALRNAIDARLAEIRAEFIEQATALGLAVVDGNAKKRKRRSSAGKEQE